MTTPQGRDNKRETPSASSRRRYLAPLWVRLLLLVVVAMSVAAGVRHRDGFWYFLAGVWLLTAAQAWLVPGTVVDAHGFRTRFAADRRAVAWPEVAEVLEGGTRLAALQVKVRLTNGKQLTLPNVPRRDVPYLHGLLTQSRPAAAPTDLPDPTAH